VYGNVIWDEFDRSYERAALWLLKSFRANHCEGSSAWSSRSFHPVRKWSRPYPETTGYIIPTIYDYLSDDPPDAREWSECVGRSVRWLLSLQLASGAFPGGHAVGDGGFYMSTSDYLLHRRRPSTPSVFNSGQILRGLTRHYRHTGDQETLRAISACVGFLLGSIRDDGYWAGDAYAGFSSPSYFTYITSSLLAARDILPDATEIDEKSIASLRAVTARVSSPASFISRMGFGGADAAFTHTVGYTLAGLLESARILGPAGNEFALVAIDALEAIKARFRSHGSLPGKFLPAWEGDWSFVCVTGNCQIGLCLLDAAEIAAGGPYRDWAHELCRSAMQTQRRSGGFPGSLPYLGEYMRLRCPNWAAKYYMDLVVRLRGGAAYP
jgi:hypothetical protein